MAVSFLFALSWSLIPKRDPAFTFPRHCLWALPDSGAKDSFSWQARLDLMQNDSLLVAASDRNVLSELLPIGISKCDLSAMVCSQSSASTSVLLDEDGTTLVTHTFFFRPPAKSWRESKPEAAYSYKVTSSNGDLLPDDQIDMQVATGFNELNQPVANVTVSFDSASTGLTTIDLEVGNRMEDEMEHHFKLDIEVLGIAFTGADIAKEMAGSADRKASFMSHFLEIFNYQSVVDRGLVITFDVSQRLRSTSMSQEELLANLELVIPESAYSREVSYPELGSGCALVDGHNDTSDLIATSCDVQFTSDLTQLIVRLRPFRASKKGPLLLRFSLASLDVGGVEARAVSELRILVSGSPPPVLTSALFPNQGSASTQERVRLDPNGGEIVVIEAYNVPDVDERNAPVFIDLRSNDESAESAGISYPEDRAFREKLDKFQLADVRMRFLSIPGNTVDWSPKITLATADSDVNTLQGENALFVEYQTLYALSVGSGVPPSMLPNILDYDSQDLHSDRANHETLITLHFGVADARLAQFMLEIGTVRESIAAHFGSSLLETLVLNATFGQFGIRYGASGPYPSDRQQIIGVWERRATPLLKGMAARQTNDQSFVLLPDVSGPLTQVYGTTFIITVRVTLPDDSAEDFDPAAMAITYAVSGKALEDTGFAMHVLRASSYSSALAVSLAIAVGAVSMSTVFATSITSISSMVASFGTNAAQAVAAVGTTTGTTTGTATGVTAGTSGAQSTSNPSFKSCFQTAGQMVVPALTGVSGLSESYLSTAKTMATFVGLPPDLCLFSFLCSADATDGNSESQAIQGFKSRTPLGIQSFYDIFASDIRKLFVAQLFYIIVGFFFFLILHTVLHFSTRKRKKVHFILMNVRWMSLTLL